MNRGWAAAPLVLASCLPLFASLGCDALTVRSFAGTVGEFTLGGVAPTPAGMHLELWARDQYEDILRVNGYTNLQKYEASYGFMIRQAVSLDDPCLIDDKGNLLTTPDAYPGPVTVAGVTQSPQEQAQQVIDRINQLAPAGQPPLLAVLPYTATQVPSIPKTTTAPDRLAMCSAYEADPLAYVANPLQITAPTHGIAYGFTSFVTITPPADYNGFRIDTPVGLKGVQEIFFTLEGDAVDANNRGPLYLVSKQTPGGIDVVHFDLLDANPNGTASGGAALYVDLDQDPVQF